MLLIFPSKTSNVPGAVFFLEGKSNRVIYESVLSMLRHNQHVY